MTESSPTTFLLVLSEKYQTPVEELAASFTEALNTDAAEEEDDE